MKADLFTIHGENCFTLVKEFLEKETEFSLKRIITDGILFFIEDYSFINSSDLMIVVRLQKIDKSGNDCEVEIVCGGGGQGLFSWTLGNENRRLHKLSDLLSDFCSGKKFKLFETKVM